MKFTLDEASKDLGVAVPELVRRDARLLPGPPVGDPGNNPSGDRSASLPVHGSCVRYDRAEPSGRFRERAPPIRPLMTPIRARGVRCGNSSWHQSKAPAPRRQWCRQTLRDRRHAESPCHRVEPRCRCVTPERGRVRVAPVGWSQKRGPIQPRRRYASAIPSRRIDE